MRGMRRVVGRVMEDSYRATAAADLRAAHLRQFGTILANHSGNVAPEQSGLCGMLTLAGVSFLREDGYFC